MAVKTSQGRRLVGGTGTDPWLRIEVAAAEAAEAGEFLAASAE
jgi:hypothetical protein